MELGLSGVRINRDPEITKARNTSNHEQAGHLEKADRAASACPRRSVLVRKQGDLQSLGKGPGSENGTPPGNRNDAFRQHLGCMQVAVGGGMSGSEQCGISHVSVAVFPRPGFP